MENIRLAFCAYLITTGTGSHCIVANIFIVFSALVAGEPGAVACFKFGALQGNHSKIMFAI